ncbi:MAG: radical SAM protein [Endomicrobiia bacterium]|nr:radical SAM protein [Endomicrobiia bacterium]
MKKVLLLNPPGRNLYIRDYYCSKTSQADYITPPIDLLMVSGYLIGDRFKVRLIDAVVDGLSVGECLADAARFAPDAVVFLVGAVSWQEDKIFLKSLSEALGQRAVFIGSGDVLREDFEKRFEELDFMDAALLDFTNGDALKIIEGADPSALENSAVRSTDGVVRRGPVAASREVSCPVPMHELFVGKNYRHPFSRARRFASVLTEFGCPYKCSFCVIAEIGYKKRPIENVIAEVSSVAAMGVREIFFATQTFGASKEYSLALCRALERLDIGWFTFSRVDVADREILSAMRRAGCHTVIFGVESGSDAILAKYRKGYDKKKIRETLGTCSELGITSVGTFILGLPEDTDETLAETLDFAVSLPLDYASFNVAVPRHGTSLRREALDDGLIGRDFAQMDQSGSEIAMRTKNLSREDVLAFRRKMVRAFYLRPSYLSGRLMKIRSVGDLLFQLRHAVALVKRTWL